MTNLHEYLFDQAPIAMWLLETNKILDCNQAALNLLGYQYKEEVIGISWFDLAASPEMEQEWTSHCLQAIQRGSLALTWRFLKRLPTTVVATERLTLQPLQLADRAIWRVSHNPDPSFYGEGSGDERLPAPLAIAKMVEQALEVTDSETMLQTIVDAIKSGFGLHDVFIYRFDEKKQALRLAVGSGHAGGQQVMTRWAVSLKATNSVVAQVGRDRLSQLVSHRKSSMTDTNAWRHGSSQLVQPLVYGDALLGVLDLRADSLNYFSDVDMDIFSLLNQQVLMLWRWVEINRQHAEAQIARQRLGHRLQEMRSALEEHLLLVTTDAQMTVTYVNDAFCQLSEYGKRDWLGEPYQAFKQATVAETIRNSLQQGQIWQGELAHQTKSRTDYWLRTTMVPFLNERGDLEQCIILCTDITNQKLLLRLDQGTQQIQQRFTAVIAAMPDLITLVDRNGLILYINSAGYQLLGLPTQHGLEGQSMFSQFYPDWVSGMLRETAIPEAMQSGIWRGEATLLHRNGREIPISQVIIVQKKEDGLIDFMAVIARDISTIKSAEKEQKRLLSELEATYRQYVRQEWGEFLAEHKNQVQQVTYHNPNYDHQPSEPETAEKTPLSKPITLRGQEIGRLNVQDDAATRTWNANEEAFVSAVAEQLALTLENLRLFEETQQRANREKIIADMTQQVWASGELELVMQTAITELGAKLDASKVVLQLGTREQLLQDETVE